MTKNCTPSLIVEVAAAIQRGSPLEEVSKQFEISPAQAAEWHRDLVEAAARISRPGEDEVVDGIAEAIAENSSQALAVIDKAGLCVYVNQSFVEMFGYTKAELYEIPLHDLIHYKYEDGSHYPSEHCPLVRAFAAHTAVSGLEDLFFRKDGRAVRVMCEASPISDKQGAEYLILEARDVTREMALESSLSLQQRRLERLFSANLLGVIYWTLDGEIEEANDEFLRIVKYSRDDLLSRNIDWRQMTPESFHAADEVAVAQLRRTGSHSTIEKQYRCKDDSLVWVAVTSALIDETRGVGFVQDISDRKSAETTLLEAQQQAIEEAQKFQEAKARLSAILEAAPVGIGMCDAQGKIIEVNKGNKLLWGDSLPYSEDVEAYKEWKGWWADGGPKHGQPIEPKDWALARALNGEDAPRDLIEIEPFNTPGTRKTVLNCGTPVRNKTGQIVGAVVAQMDLSDWIKSEKALRESELKFRTITDAMPQMVFSSLPGGYNDYQNKHLYDFTGAEPASLEGEAWMSVVHSDDTDRCRELWSHSLQTGTPYEIKYRIRHKSGEYRWALSRALPIKDSNGQIIRWLGTCTDIHQQVLIQEALEDADKKKDEFIALLAHELRNPLAPVRTALDIFRLRPPADDTLKRAVNIMDRQVKQMSSLIDDLLDVARITRGKVSLKLQRCDLTLILKTACEDHRGPMSEAGVDLHLNLPEHSIHVEGDHIRLTQIFGNLLHNACKYSSIGGNVRVNGSIAEGAEGNPSVLVSVEDDGQGMSPELVGRLFKPFTQAEERTEKLNGGLGLGLAIVKGLVELHGGTVRAESAGPGKGSAIHVTLPTSQKIEKQIGEKDKMDFASSVKKILMIDDNEDFAFAMSSALSSFGHDVAVAHTAKAGVTSFQAFKPDVVICDIGLPDMDGYAVARSLSESLGADKNKPFMIALSGYGQDSDKERASEAGFDVHLTKPVDLEILLGFL